MDPMLSPVALQGLPSLKSLTQYRGWTLDSSLCHLKTWLSMLPLLSELSISLGYQLGANANSVPGTVQSLSLKGMVGELKALREMAQQVPDLFYLHLDLCGHERHSFIAEVPQLFPKLQSLKMRHHSVPETEFLQLAQMSYLKHIMVLDAHNLSPNSALMDLAHKLHIQTNNRDHVIHSSEAKDRNVCFCAYEIGPVLPCNLDNEFLIIH
ncbi:uncharacterized protein im:7136021 [Pygocentrus nattereri]|uniref:uncharacterized protein im:7136021 n=1 Tax=Pygocentrus nattereri TaxID=42514 RepID=UPI000814A715|nr:uncharacterized protein im:7136021 [Pygocentrus nattereri]XP_017540207.1 uncharacterized protein im:7136021 [Pygocentrus nattereri]XP_017540208.1 uncharacterized protein im:7136021 [Pygocentrus nattereri]